MALSNAITLPVIHSLYTLACLLYYPQISDYLHVQIPIIYPVPKYIDFFGGKISYMPICKHEYVVCTNMWRKILNLTWLNYIVSRSIRAQKRDRFMFHMELITAQLIEHTICIGLSIPVIIDLGTLARGSGRKRSGRKNAGNVRLAGR